MKKSTCIEKANVLPKLAIMAMTLVLSVSFAIGNASDDVYSYLI